MFYIFLFLAIGLIHGLAATLLVKDGVSRTVNMVVGVLGAFVGGMVAVNYSTQGISVLAQILISSTGAIVLLFWAALFELAFGKHRIPDDPNASSKPH